MNKGWPKGKPRRSSPRPPHCTVEGCSKPLMPKGYLCGMHASRKTRHGSVNLGSQQDRGGWAKSTCSACGKTDKISRGFCQRCYQRWRKYGTPEGSRASARRSTVYAPGLRASMAHLARSRGCLDVRFVAGRSIKRLVEADCWWCDQPADTIDHLIPISRGGRHAEGNLVPCCRACNGAKRDRLPVEFRRMR